MERIEAYSMGIQLEQEQMIQLEKKIEDFFEQNKVKYDIPVDIFDITHQLGFDVRGADFPDEIGGMILVNEQIDKIGNFRSNKVIAYNYNKDLQAQKFIVAHELAHYIDRKVEKPNENILVAAREKTGSYGDNIEEQQKDYMGAALLVPKNDLIMEKKNNSLSNEDFIEKMSKRYDTTNELIKRRIDEVPA